MSNPAEKEPFDHDAMIERMTNEVALLMEVMGGAGVPINGAFVTNDGDVPRFALIDNGEGWEVCSDGQGKFDLWHEGSLHTPGLSLPTAAGSLAHIYIASKVHRVLARQAAKAGG